MQRSRWGLTRVEQRGRITSLSPLAFDAAQDMVGLLGCECTLPDHAEVLAMLATARSYRLEL